MKGVITDARLCSIFIFPIIRCSKTITEWVVKTTRNQHRIRTLTYSILKSAKIEALSFKTHDAMCTPQTKVH